MVSREAGPLGKNGQGRQKTARRAGRTGTQLARLPLACVNVRPERCHPKAGSDADRERDGERHDLALPVPVRGRQEVRKQAVCPREHDVIEQHQATRRRQPFEIEQSRPQHADDATENEEQPNHAGDADQTVHSTSRLCPDIAAA